jgi:5-(aminomethyl)-3-furanmethanol phosphate kinase
VTTVLKVGGGLGEDPGALRALCAAIGDAAARHRLLVVPGGGRLADAVRAEDERFGMRADTHHRMAILAMDQFGLLLADLIPRAGLCEDLAAAAAVMDEARPAVLLPERLTRGAPDLPASWDVTSDSIAAWVAGRAGAERVVLLKADDRATGVDGHFATALAAAGVEAWVIGGDEPGRLVELLETGAVAGGLRLAPLLQ